MLLAGILPVWADEESRLPAYSRVYDPGRDSFADSHAALDLASRTGKRLLMELGGDWCTYCLQLDRFINSRPQLRQLLQENFVILKVNVSDENLNEEFLSGLPETDGYPHFYISENDGTIIHSQDTARFMQDGDYSEQRILNFLRAWSKTDDPVRRP